MRNLRFIKDNGTWYVDLPDWEGNREELSMVAGADTLLDIISNNRETISINVDINPFEGHTGVLSKVEGTGNYIYDGIKVNNHELWLCEVCLFVFGSYPDNIYLKNVA